MTNAVPLATGVASPADIRAHFPALARAHAAHPVAYFDGPGGTQVPREVVEAMNDYLYHHNANTHWQYPTSAETDAIIARSRDVLAAFLNASPSEVAFGANMTTLTFHLARAIGRGLGASDEIVVTELDHHANVAPWMAIAKERGVTVRTVRMHSETGQLDTDDLARQLTVRTRLLAIGAASNALGTITNVREAARLAHDAGALVFVDAVHYAPHALVDVRDIDCDFLACSAYKFYGPHIGVLYGKRDLLQALDVPKLQPSPDTAPERLETGTQNHEGMAGAAAAVEFLASLAVGPIVMRVPADGATRAAQTILAGDGLRPRLQGAYGALHARSTSLVTRLWDGLSSISRVKVFGPGPDAPRTPTVSFVVTGVPSDEVARGLADVGVFVSSGDFYAATVVERLGVARQGLVRVGCACYTTQEEVDRLILGVEAIAAERRRQS
ncbi:MAG TPA: cysteine desulfurase-like protein [Gemmatimonadaceae bacterium]|nr:cysteine desulfurase-like protein [Gemmatimonadaceae bacterium]